MRSAPAVIAALLASALCVANPATALAAEPTPGGLGQSVDPGQAQATGRAVLESGHVDIGPRLRDGEWTIQIHDDHAVPSVWREPADTVLRVRDTALQQVPDDEAYAFLGAGAGERVHVVPQTEKPGVVWIGWNTQDPGVLGAIDRGVTMNLRGVQGPGPVTVFLQSGNLGAPQVLWTSAKPFPQPIWVESNTHTHANWVFGKPGTYLLALEITDGAGLTANTVLRLAVGDGTDPEAALTSEFTAALPSAAVAAPVGEPSTPGGGTTLLLIIGGVLVVLVIAAVAVRQGTVRRRAEREAGR